MAPVFTQLPPIQLPASAGTPSSAPAAQLVEQQGRCQGAALKRRLQEELDQLLLRREELSRIAALLRPSTDPLLWSLFREITRRPLRPVVL